MIFHISPSLLETAACLYRFRLYRILGRKSAEIRSGLDAGSCLHAGFAAMLSGKPADAQDDAVLARRAELPMTETDYRTGSYLVAALAQLRAELAPSLASWRIIEVEQLRTVDLGRVPAALVHPRWLPYLTHEEPARNAVLVRLRFLRDAVLECDRNIVILDLKSRSRDDKADIAAFQNSGQFKAYARAWNVEHPEQPCGYVQPLRLVMRAPSRTGVAYTVKLDGPVRFDESVLDEWHSNVMNRACDILRRDPDYERDWPMTDSPAGLCRDQWGACTFLSVCTKPPGDRPLKLSTGAFVSSRREGTE